MKLLGIDYGLRRIGVAISDGLIAAPLGVVEDLAGVVRLATTHQIEKIVIGLPDPNNSHVKEFGQRLTELTNIPVEYWDETLSTREARKKMIASGVPKKTRQKSIDQQAAAVILQSFIDNKDEGVPL